MSAVGFNRQGTLAIVYTWRNVKLVCNNHCSARSCPVPAGAAENFHFLKKTNGKWKLDGAGGKLAVIIVLWILTSM